MAKMMPVCATCKKPNCKSHLSKAFGAAAVKPVLNNLQAKPGQNNKKPMLRPMPKPKVVS